MNGSGRFDAAEQSARAAGARDLVTLPTLTLSVGKNTNDWIAGIAYDSSKPRINRNPNEHDPTPAPIRNRPGGTPV